MANSLNQIRLMGNCCTLMDSLYGYRSFMMIQPHECLLHIIYCLSVQRSHHSRNFTLMCKEENFQVLTWFQVFCHWQNTWNQVRTWQCLMKFTYLHVVGKTPCNISGFYSHDWIWSFGFLAATKQLYKWYFPSVCPSVCPSVRPSVCPSVCHTFLTMFPSSYHHEIFRSYYQWQK